MSYVELAELKDRVEVAMFERKAQEAKELKAQLEAMAQESGFELAELVGVKKKRSGKTVTAPKYRNPDDPSQTWTGRGRKPNWIVEALERGEDLESFEI